MKYEIRFTSQFKKDIKLAKKQSKDIEKVLGVINSLANGEVLAPALRDHALTGSYAGYRECHVEPDWLLVYRIDSGILVLLLYRLGSHADLFK